MSTSNKITAAMLYDMVQCPHRPTMDLFGDSELRDEANPFIQLLWEKGTTFEHEVIDRYKATIVDLSSSTGEDKEQLTRDAMLRGEPLIYSGRISFDDLMGEPDLLRKEGDGYVAGDIKSGSGQEGHDEKAKLKRHYGVQLSLYTDILERQGFATSRRPFIWDICGEEVIYDLDEPQGKRNPSTVWEVYQSALAQAQMIVVKSLVTRPAYSGACKLCHWYSACLENLEEVDDLTLLPELGRSKRDVMSGEIPTVATLATANIEDFVSGGKTNFKGIGPASLRKYKDRAILNTVAGSKPYLTALLLLPSSDIELFFDIEVDPMRDICYLHGFVERRGGDNSTEQYVAFFAEGISAEEEERAFREAWQYIVSHQPCAVYYYSKYERTIWRQLQTKYPSVCTADEIEALFRSDKSVDLYFDVVRKATEWPTRDYSIKTLAKYLGFNWRDTNPSGAASIEWFDRWIETNDTTIKQRILDYNEDDCVATRVLLDGIRAL
ncbi:MAG: TM0106 family RecB-like putative nuclease [Bacteroidetes Order II. Incertae sedis bacterium]|jgi:predicted RecB family nuclease|nr:TM0106 family RecB-like putative nuclease [Bacteroidetes Order II. bacterium]